MRRLTLQASHAIDDLWIAALLKLRACLTRLIGAALLRQDARAIASILEIPTCGKH